MSDDPKFPLKWDNGEGAVQAGSSSLRQQRQEKALSRGGAKSSGSATITRIVDLLIKATAEGKVHWWRDAEYFAITYFPMLAVSFRLQIAGPVQSQLGGAWTATGEAWHDASKAQHMTIAFIDNKEFRCLSSQFPRLHELSKLVWSTFEDTFQRDRNERLEWLERALESFLPHVVSSQE